MADNPKLPSLTGTGPKHQAVNTMGPTPEYIPVNEGEREKYFRERADRYNDTSANIAEVRANRARMAAAGRDHQTQLKAAGQQHTASLSAAQRHIEELRQRAERERPREPDRSRDR